MSVGKILTRTWLAATERSETVYGRKGSVTIMARDNHDVVYSIQIPTKKTAISRNYANGETLSCLLSIPRGNNAGAQLRNTDPSCNLGSSLFVCSAYDDKLCLLFL